MEKLVAGDEISDPLEPYLAVDRSDPRHECWVAGHMVAGIDGTARVDGRVGALSTAPDQSLFRRMRQIADVVLVGAETVRREGYGPVKLTDQDQRARTDRGLAPVPPIAIVSRSLTIDWTSRIFASHAYVITCEAADQEAQRQAADHAEVIIAGEERVEPALALVALRNRGHRLVLCEGGPHWLGELVAADRLDELFLSISPKMGGDDLPICVTPPGSRLLDFKLEAAMREDDSLFLRYERN